MKILLLVFLLAAGASGQQQQQLPQSAPMSPNVGSEAESNQAKARAILAKTIQALGGDAYMNLQDSYTEGRYGRFHNEVMVGGTVYFRYWQWPDKERIELTKQRDVVDLYVGDHATEITFRGAHELDPKQDDLVRLALQRRHYTLERILREWLKEPDILLLYEGQSLSANNKMTDKVTLINAQNQSVSLLIAPDTHLPAEKIFTTRDPATRDLDEEDEIYDNWRVVQGINTPYSIEIIRNGQIVRQQYLFNVSYGTRPPDSYFTPVLIPRPSK
ncbi:MAG TPA: hypothetical protein VFP59_00165 [Candidatus Angelobacter sp.]|nr:hypothetical protein [Candidatus Angelobacter sp.]